MPKDPLQYNRLVEEALRDVVRRALDEVAQDGLPGNHHFYITFRTSYPGVKIPDHLRARFPAEMTIVLQYQFYDLLVDSEKFSVTLSFSNRPEELVIPLRAITVFADPSVNFALPFQPFDADGEAVETPAVEDAKPEAPASREKAGEVVSLDQFRRK
jgi:hypothetical protein